MKRAENTAHGQGQGRATCRLWEVRDSGGGMPAPRQLMRMCRFSLNFLLVETFPNHVPWNSSTPPTVNACLRITEIGDALEDYDFLKCNAQH